MPATTTFRLPGVYFLGAPRAGAAVLPPLDVAGLVGFATRGPVDVAVPIDDQNSFDAVFGGAFALARATDGSLTYAYLRDAVSAFFSCGGRRCYIVRVAGDRAVPARFAISGMVAIDATGEVQRAELDASSAGAWANPMQLGTLLTVTLLPPDSFGIEDGLTLSWTTTGMPQAVQLGDVLRLTLVDGRQWLFPVANILQGTQVAAGTQDTPSSTLKAAAVWPLITAAPQTSPLISSVGRLTLQGLDQLDVAAEFVGGAGPSLLLSGADALLVAREDVLRLDLADGSVFVVGVGDAEAQLSSGSLPNTNVMVTATDMLCVHSAGGIAPVLPTTVQLLRVELLQLSLRIKYGEAAVRELDALGFNSGHTRFWGEVAVSESGSIAGSSISTSGTSQGQQPPALAPGVASQLYAALFGPERTDLDWTDTRLGGILPTLFAPAQAGLTYLPVGMPVIGDNDDLVGPDPSALGADDLDTFTTQLFLDDYLTGVAPASLLATATDRYFLQDVRLQGIHGLMFVDDVALIAVPDAVQLGWVASQLVPPGPAPATSAAAGPCSLPGPRPTGFLDCAVAPTLLAVDPDSGPAGGGTTVTLTGSGFQSADTLSISFGARAAQAVQVVDDTHLTCSTPPAVALGPVTVTLADSAGTVSLAAAFDYWQPSTAPPLPVVADVSNFDAMGLQSLHTSLLALCEARADAVAILGLPLHFEKEDCIGWLQGLRSGLGLPRHGSVYNDAREIADLSYVAVYHPWLLVPDPTGAAGALKPIPPEGAICGAIAAREIARQVWVAPANVPLPVVLDLQPALSDDDWAELFALGFNLVRQEARDFRVMSAHTLSDNQSLLQLSVRRLLIQLRKAALQLGQDYVFANNDQRFLQRVRQALEGLLRQMFDGGAFAGVSQQSSYSVVVDSSVNTTTDYEQGRAIAEILVAPSQPMEFLTVTLTRTGTGQLQTAESITQ